MSQAPLAPATAVTGKVLVVDDDRRVREVLEAALTTHGFGVITASDGEEALQRAQRERPDLVLLDVRLPKRSGLEVCDVLRGDPTDPSVPIILISAAAETDQRLLGFQRGADDVLAKPFSPKELVARIRRLLARAAETRTAQRRSRELERELSSVRREAQRAGEDARREQDLREVADVGGRELLRVLDLDRLATRLLELVQARSHATAVGLLVTDGADALRPYAMRGDRWSRLAGARLPRRGDLAELLAGLARPVRCAELHRLHGSLELQPLIAARWDRLLPVVSAEALEAVLLIEGSTTDPAPAAMLQGLAVLAGFAGVAVRNGLDVRAQAAAALSELAPRDPRADLNVALESRRLLDHACDAAAVPPGDRTALAHALELAAMPPGVRVRLETLAGSDPSGLARATARLLAEADGPAEHRTLVGTLLRAVLDHRELRARGASPADAAQRAEQVLASVDLGLAERLAAHALTLTPSTRDAA